MKWKESGETADMSAENNNEIITILLNNRGLTTKKEIEEFLNPSDPMQLAADKLGIDGKELEKSVKRIHKAIKNQEQIIVYGDYDCDGISSTAIVWETLNKMGANALPFIPLREKEGYGLSKEGIDSIFADSKYKLSGSGLIITVDSGIVANEAVDYAKAKNLDVIIIDHHEKPDKLPNAQAIIHTTQLCAAAISFIFAKELTSGSLPLIPSLELAAIATITDLMPLVGPNRSIVKYGLETLSHTSRIGLQELFDVAGIKKVGTYEIGYMIGPRINASGRIENALTALRLLCTNNRQKAAELAQVLNETNKERQGMLEELTVHALQTTGQRLQTSDRIIVIEDESYHQGIIGLIAGKIVERYYLPAIVISKGKDVSKASARSISGFNIIEAIRSASVILLGAGGHPMAAGFSIATAEITKFKTEISKIAEEKITPDMLEKTLRIDLKLDPKLLTINLYSEIQKLAPFGLGNPEPVFKSDFKINNLRLVGADGKHLKLQLTPNITGDSLHFDAIAFNQGSLAAKLKEGDSVQIAYTLDLNTYNGKQDLQLKIKDIKTDGRTTSENQKL